MPHRLAVLGVLLAGLVLPGLARAQVTLEFYKYHDVNADGDHDFFSEDYLEGFQIRVVDEPTGGQLFDATATTAETGFAHVTDVGAGTYLISEVAQAGYVQTEPEADAYTVVVTADGDVQDEFGNALSTVFAFGNATGANVEGAVFEDLDGDWNYDDGEPLLPGWTVFHDANTNGILDPGEKSATTDDSGMYLITDVPPNKLNRFVEILQPGWEASNYKNYTRKVISVSPGNTLRLDFGNLRTGPNQPPSGLSFSPDDNQTVFLQDPSLTTNTVRVSGRVTDPEGDLTSVTVNTVIFQPYVEDTGSGTYAFDGDVALDAGLGTQSITVRAEDGEGEAVEESHTIVKAQNHEPAWDDLAPLHGATIVVADLQQEQQVPVSGSVFDADGNLTYITVNTAAVVFEHLDSDPGRYAFQGQATIAGGTQSAVIAVEAGDDAGATASLARTVNFLQNTAPSGLSFTPHDNAVIPVASATGPNTVAVSGTVTDAENNLASVTVNSIHMELGPTDTGAGLYGFSGEVGLAPGAGLQQLDVAATDDLGALLSRSHSIFVQPAPAVSGIGPCCGSTAGGDALQILGSDFVDGCTASVGGTSCTPTTYVDATTLSCTTPAGSPGPADVVVTNPDGRSATLTGAFTYQFQGSKPVQAGTDVSVTFDVPVGEAAVPALTFAQVDGAGSCSLQTGGEPPAGGETSPADYCSDCTTTYYDITTDASFTGTVELCLDYGATSLAGNGTEEQFALFHFTAGGWVDVTTNRDPAADRLCGETDSFSVFALFEPAAIQVAYDPPAGWSLVSLPVAAADSSLATLFPDAISLFGFSGGYQAAASLSQGAGFWVNLPDPPAGGYTVTGTPGGLVVDLPAGWSLVGPASTAVDVAALMAAHDQIVSVFGFDGGYQAAASMEPGRGYWIHMSSSASVDLGTAPSPAARVAAVPPAIARPRLWVQDGDARQIIELGVSPEAVEALPPLPPPGTLDLRVVVDGVETWRVPATRMAAAYAVHIRGRQPQLAWDVADTDSPRWSLEVGERLVPLSGRGSVEVPAHGTPIRLRQAARPSALRLSQNHPNPFNPETTIAFELPAPARVEVTIYNLAGQRVATPLSAWREAGAHSLRWNARDDDGRALASGVYFYRLRSGGHMRTRRLLLLR